MRDTSLMTGPATFFAVVAAAALCGCAPTGPAAPYGLAARLPYAACGDMATLRANLTGERDPTPESDATLRGLGVRCLGQAPIALRARY